MKISRFSLSSAAIRPFLQFPAGALQFLGDELFAWKDSLILGPRFASKSLTEWGGTPASLFVVRVRDRDRPAKPETQEDLL
jgi:hypothetical protein